MPKYVFVTGGVVSSIGKGIASACLGRLLRNRGYAVTVQKIDPYLNVDAGTMNPHQHGEVFVTDDGAETDLDLGHYERFVDINLNKQCNLTTGKVYGNVIAKERRGDYLGDTVQVIPHVTDEIKERIRELPRDAGAEIAIVEIGGTIGDIEGLPFLEAIRQMRADEGHGNCAFVHVTLIPFVGPRREMKTKPTQHSVRELRSIGIQPDVVLCRTKQPLSKEMRRKIALFCDINDEAIIEGIDTEIVYELPVIFERQGLARIVLKKLGLEDRSVDLSEWEELVEAIRHPRVTCRIAMVGKYMELHDAYISIFDALRHGAAKHRVEAEVIRVDSEAIQREGAAAHLSGIDGILVPGGFGKRGIEGKIQAIRHAREHNIPFLGLCLGLQCAVIEFARDVCGLARANSTEFDPQTPYPVIDILPEQLDVEDMGGTMRLGAWPCVLSPDTLAARLYGATDVSERHRHRYEVNPVYHDDLRKHGLVLSGMSPDGRLVELIELPNHPFFIATQAHPEFKSRPTRAHPLFAGFIAAAAGKNGERDGLTGRP